jgi:hypothetical protein
MTTEPTPDEEARLAERAKRIWGENPFSPEAMAADTKLNAQERTYNDTIRYRRMRDLEEEH